MADEKPYNISIETKAQLEEIQKLLSELRSINAEISKINGQTFSSVSASAAELSQTGKDLAKALVSQRIVSEELNKTLGKTGAGLAKAKDKAKELKDEVDGAATTIEGFYLELGAMAARMATHLPSAVTTAIQAFGQQEAAVQKLAAAIRSQGGNVSEVLPIMSSFASEMQRITTYGDEQVLAMQSMATAMGVSADQMNLCIQGAIGLTNVYEIGLNEAVRAAASVVQGKTEKLNELIPALSKCKSETEKYALAEKAMKDGFAQAEAAANTLDGKLKQAAKAWGDLQEVVGEAFAPTVKTVAGLIKGICELLAENTAITKTLTTALAACAVGFAFTKVGGLVSVAKMFLGISTATKAATTAMHGLNLAIKSNPIGMIASLATGAILGLSQLIDYVSSLESEEEKEAAAQEAAAEARRKAASDALAASAVLDEYANAMARESETATDTASRISALSDEIEKLSDRSKWGENEQEAAAQKLVEKKKELVELQKKYLEQVKASAEAEYQYASNQETERKYRVEQELNAARKTGITHIIKFKEAELKYVEELQKSVEIQKKYYADHAHLVKSEEDRQRIMADAKAYAEMSLKNMREENRQAEQRASTEKWLAAEVEGNKTEQRGLEMDILRARASGNEELAKEIEGKLRVSQIASEIFEATRKEGMSRKELESLMETARGQAQERYDLEKSVSDELERQNLAKDAQAKIEDILLANKIEQLKAEGKITEARELEREREIKRTLAGLKGVSDEDKEKLANTMRQTNSYRDKQEKTRFGGGTGIGYRSGSESSFGSSAYRYGDSLGGAAKYSGPTPARRPRPASVSAKYLGLYDDWRANGGSRSGVSWTDYRNSRRAEVDAAANAEKNYQKNVAADANTPVVKQRARASNALAEITQESESIASRITLGGAMNSITKNTPQEAPRKSPKTNADTVDEIAFNASRRGSKTPPDKNISSRQDTQNFGSPSAIRLLSSIEKTVKSIASS